MMNITEISFIIKDTLVGLPHIIYCIITKIIWICWFSGVCLIMFGLTYLAVVCDQLFGTNLMNRVRELLFK